MEFVFVLMKIFFLSDYMEFPVLLDGGHTIVLYFYEGRNVILPAL